MLTKLSSQIMLMMSQVSVFRQWLWPSWVVPSPPSVIQGLNPGCSALHCISNPSYFLFWNTISLLCLAWPQICHPLASALRAAGITGTGLCYSKLHASALICEMGNNTCVAGLRMKWDEDILIAEYTAHRKPSWLLMVADHFSLPYVPYVSWEASSGFCFLRGPHEPVTLLKPSCTFSHLQGR